MNNDKMTFGRGLRIAFQTASAALATVISVNPGFGLMSGAALCDYVESRVSKKNAP